MLQTEKRMSIRATAMRLGLPTRVISRAVWSGELVAIHTTTETGRERIYIRFADADNWFKSLSSESKTASVGGAE